jgi:hypothetical protein
MLKKILILTLFITGFVAYAQTPLTINQDNFPLPATDTVKWRSMDTTGLTVPVPGANLTWNYSNRTQLTSYMYNIYMQANNQDFPTAVRKNKSNIILGPFALTRYYYTTIDSNSYRELGVTTDALNQSLVQYTGNPNDLLSIPAQTDIHTIPRRHVVFPMTYNSSWLDSNLIYYTNVNRTIGAFGLSNTPCQEKQYATYHSTVTSYGKCLINKAGSPSIPYDVLFCKHTIVTKDSFFLAGNPMPQTLLTAFGLTQGAVNYYSEHSFYRSGTSHSLAIFDGNNQNPNTIQSFGCSMDADIQLLTGPSLLLPENNSTFVSLNPQLTWNPVDYADGCTLQVATDQNFSNIVLNQPNIANSYFNLTNLLVNTMYYWRVKSTGVNWESPWSTIWNFTTLIDPSLTYSIAGTVSYDNNQETPLSNCTVKLNDMNGNIILQTSTDVSGNYYFSNVAPGAYKIVVSTTKPHGGMTIQDVMLTKQKIAFLEQFSPLQNTAADVDVNNIVNVLDVMGMRQKLAFLNPPQWTIADYVFEMPTVTITNENITVNIKGLCAGDVNGSYVPPY